MTTPTQPQLPEEVKPRIVAAAVIHGGVVHTAPHHHLAMWQISCCWGEKAHGEQGFVASDGKFYGREESYQIAKAAGQIKFPLPYEHDDLFSEELWSYADWLKERKMGDSPDATPCLAPRQDAERAKRAPGLNLPWRVESVPNPDAEYSEGGPESHKGFVAYAIVDSKGRILFDSINRDPLASLIQEEVDENGVHAWDADAKRDAVLITQAMSRHAPDQSAQLAAARSEIRFLQQINDGLADECNKLSGECERTSAVEDNVRLRAQLATLRQERDRAKASDEYSFSILKKCHEVLKMNDDESYSLIPGEIEEWLMQVGYLKEKEVKATDRAVLLQVDLGKLKTEHEALRQERDELIKQRNEVTGLYYQAKQGEIPKLTGERDTPLAERDELRGLLQDISDYREGKGRFNYSGKPEQERANEAHDAWESIYTRIRAKLEEGV